MNYIKIIRNIIIVGLVLSLFPVYILINRVQHDFPLREYVKETFLAQLKGDIQTYLGGTVATDKIHRLYLNISDSALANLEEQISNRFEQIELSDVVLQNDAWNYVNAKAIMGSDSFKIDLRIRGDMPSNFNQGIHKATLRLNVKKGKLLNGKNKLSIIRPMMESGYYGFLFYKCFKDEGFIANHIEIIKLYINGEYAGLRFMQEGFADELIDSAGKNPGPILRFKNDCTDNEGRYNTSKLPKLEAYSEKKNLKNTEQATIYAEAISRYEKLKQHELEISDCFDLDEYARYYALCDIFLAHHSNKCQNVKLYYNPAHKKFEPIAWDPNNYVRYEVGLSITPGHTQRFGELCNNIEGYPLHHLFSLDSTFLRKYVDYLATYATTAKLDQLINQYRNTIAQTEPDIFRQNFQELFRSEKFEMNISNIQRDFKQKNIAYGYYFNTDKKLFVRSACNLPIAIDSISFANNTIELNQIIAPNSCLEQKAFLDTITDFTKSFKIYARILNSKVSSVNEGTLFNAAYH